VTSKYNISQLIKLHLIKNIILDRIEMNEAINKKDSKDLDQDIINSETCVQRPPLGPPKSVHLTEVLDKSDI
jgi:hypothetical protein